MLFLKVVDEVDDDIWGKCFGFGGGCYVGMKDVDVCIVGYDGEFF